MAEKDRLDQHKEKTENSRIIIEIQFLYLYTYIALFSAWPWKVKYSSLGHRIFSLVALN